ncbi:arylamine N-acetyltransferase [Sphaerisporangium sp. TRM90804]|uniref:arylamine N-acetyltransferase family protein n=1 Tax=Sphaerisporangium sp. TRM90804 TaxID=3031113 RepID=UPI002449E4CA|nr:arylamine N-acetyltransferase [Sphaerisporangium sp. TRM90804]MDH2427956.1 arylamine N-acetyltransferase [Sphaerisporangium sp. TRM90804]
MTRSLDVSAYLDRLGVKGLDDEPSVESLVRLHRAHVERVPYECLDIWLGRATTIDPMDSAERIARGRGGYCFHLNGAFSALLRRLGYRVTRQLAGAQNTPADLAGAHGNHLALTVSGLPSPECPSGEWWVDVGLGDALHEPLPLVEGAYRQGPFTYVLRRSQAESGGWRLEHDPRGSFHAIDVRPGAVDMAAFAVKHRYLCTSPESGFVRVLCVQRRDAAGVDALRGLVLSRVGSDQVTTTLTSARDLYEALADVFGLTLDDVGRPERDALWKRLEEAHERWLAASGAGGGRPPRGAPAS